MSLISSHSEPNLQDAHTRYRLITNISSILLATSDSEAILHRVVQQLVPDLGEWSMVNVSYLDGAKSRHSEARAMSAEKSLIIDEIRQRFPPSPLAPLGLGSVIRTGKSELFHDLSKNTDILRRINPDPDYLGLWQGLGIVSYIGVPIKINGKIYGGLAVDSLTPGRYFTLSDLAFLEEIANLISLAVERAMLIKQANESNRQKAEFLTNMSHEIRTPLTAIQGFATLLTTEKSQPNERQKWVTNILNSSQHLEFLINDLLDLSKIESEKVEIESTAIDLSNTISDLDAVFQLKAAEKGLIVNWSIQNNVPAVIKTDERRLKQILLNIIGNAIKFTQQGRVDVNIKMIKSGESNHAERLSISVSDTGIGIGSQHHQNIFDAFTQADGSISRRFGGTGLGLTLSKRIAALLGGELILAHSAINQGSCFVLTLDPGPRDAGALYENTTRSQTKAAIQQENSAGFDIQGVRVLLVDDAVEIRIILEYLLKSQGAEVMVACNGQEALDQIEQDSFDLILMDIQMPIMDGFQTIRQLRNKGYVIPIIAITAHALNDEKERCLAEGFNNYLSKPIKFDRLLELVSQVKSRAAATIHS